MKTYLLAWVVYVVATFTMWPCDIAEVGATLSPPPPQHDDVGPLTFGVGKSQIYLSPKEETLLLSHTVSPGVTQAAIRFFWITGDPMSGKPGDCKSGADYVLWRFYIDGETNASVQVQTSQAAFVGNADPSAPWDNEYFGKNSCYGGWHVNVPIPFSKSVKVTLQLPTWWTFQLPTIWVMCRGVENLPLQIAGFTLPSTARLTAAVSNASLAPLEFHTLATVSDDKAGLMLGTMIDIHMYGAFPHNGGTLNTLEGCWHAYSPPDVPFPGLILGTGAEDYPESAFYFNAGPFRGPTSGLTVCEPEPACTGISTNATEARISFYKLHTRDPFFFRQGFKFQWRNGDVDDKSTGQKCTALEGNVDGHPSFANITTLVYLYTW